MTQIERAKLFATLHVKGDPLILFNIWDAGSARAAAEAGAKAIATGSWSVAAAYGCNDGEELPLDLAIANAKRIVAAVDLPVTIDFEGGYGESSEAIAANVSQLIETGAVGCNFEDQIVGGDGIYCIEHQCARIEAMRRAAEQTAVPNFFINARTDIFLKADPAEHDDNRLKEAASRVSAYARAGASGFFAPGLRQPEQIRKLCELSPLPVNIMALPDAPSSRELADLGVARISYGPGPYREMIASLKTAARQALALG
jgi:2-methylisocitrate lyase-like PEP mutase family enzyme